jgi:hypothetical protein
MSGLITEYRAQRFQDADLQRKVPAFFGNVMP